VPLKAVIQTTTARKSRRFLGMFNQQPDIAVGANSRKLHRVSQGVAQGMARNNAVKTATYESANNKCSPRLKNESSGMPQLLCQPRIQEDTPSVDLIWFAALG
jgi:hypothetical protein